MVKPNDTEWALKQCLSIMIQHGRPSIHEGLLSPDRITYNEISRLLREVIEEEGETWPAVRYFPDHEEVSLHDRERFVEVTFEDTEEEIPENW